MEDINLSSDEECPSGWWAPSPSGTERTTSQQASDIANALEERLKHEEPHVLAKRLIYKKYLQSYIPSMLSVQDKTITVVDGFAGKGRATDLGWPTEIEHYETPIIALRVALHYFKKKGKEDVAFDNEIDFDVDGYLNDIENLRMYAGDQFKIDSSDKHRVVLVFVENDKNAYIELVKNVIKIIKMYRLRVDEKEDFKHGFCKVRCDFKGTKRTKSEYLVACYIVHADFTKLAAFTGNCILVLNTQGDKRIPLDVVKRSVDSRKQVFVSLNSQIVSPDHDHSTTVNSERHTNHLTVKHLDDYERLLIQNSHTDCFLSLEMQGYTNNVTGHILFGASHMKSYKCIKESMNTVRQGLQTSLICCFTNFKDFRECDRLRLPHKFKVSDIATANAIYDRFRGTQTVMSEVEKYIWLETPYVFRKTPLKILEDNGKLIVKTDYSKRRKGTYPDFRDWNFVLR